MKSILLHTRQGRLEGVGGADSAVLRPGEPVFLPEPFESLRSYVAPAVRISRLGMNIKPSFAGRYYSEIAALHLLIDEACPLPPLFCDRAIAPGKWIDIASIDNADLRVELYDRDDALINEQNKAIALCALDIDNAVNFVSSHLTLKTGDMIIFGDHAGELGCPKINTRLRACIGGAESLEIRFK